MEDAIIFAIRLWHRNYHFKYYEEMEMKSLTAVSHGNLGVCACGQHRLPYSHSCDDGILILALSLSFAPSRF